MVRMHFILRFLILLLLIPSGASAVPPVPQGTYKDYARHHRDALALAEIHKERLITPQQLLDMMQDPNTVLIDVRDIERYAKSHIKGAKNYSPFIFSDKEFQELVPDKETKIILYCDNGLSYIAGPPKKNMRAISLTSLAFPYLYTLGYHNLYELQNGLTSIRNNEDVSVPMESSDLETLIKQHNSHHDRK